MIAYGTKIISDIPFPQDLSHDTAVRYRVELSALIPDTIQSAITCGVPFYQAHGRKVYLYSDRDLEGSETAQPWCYEVKDVVRFYWQSGERTIYYQLDREGSPELLCFWFVHLLLPLFCTLEGMYDFLHAGADHRPYRKFEERDTGSTGLQQHSSSFLKIFSGFNNI